MRVTQRTMYNSFINNMQSTLSAYMESNMQGASQKKINRPSDDPAGMALVLNTRRNIDTTVQLKRNVDTAEGWLNLADTTLMQVSEAITKLKGLAEQAATGTYSAENRLQISMEIRQIFGQLLNLSNKQFEGKSIFAGHKYTEPAFEETLAVNTMDPALQNTQFTVTGDTERSIMLAFEQPGGIIGQGTINYQWSDDGGATWKQGSPTSLVGTNQITMGGVKLTIPMDTPITGAYAPPLDPENLDASVGTVLYIRPTAVYKGDTQGAEPYAIIPNAPMGLTTTVQGNLTNNVPVVFGGSLDLWLSPGANFTCTIDGTIYNGTMPNPANGKLTLPLPNGGSIEFNAPPGTGPIPAGTIDIQPRRVDVMGGPVGLTVNAQGVFNKNVMVNIDNVTGTKIDYSYSTDYGQTWITATTNSNRLPVPGGYMELSGTPVTPGTQCIIHPDRADLNYEIMKDTYVSVNSVGSTIFGGIYQNQLGLPAEQNLFEIVGKLIAYTENNNQTGVQQCLAALTTAQEKVLTETARIGGLENRLTLAKDVLSFDKLDQEAQLSYTEDVNLTELLTRLSQQQLAYNTVLQSSSMIMQLNLAKFL